MLKVAFFQGADESGPRAIPLFSPADAVFEKTAAPKLLPDVAKYIAGLRPNSDSQYVLVNAMGASEWWGANINGDAFPEASLIHKPDDWTGNPLIDKEKAKDWAYGFPTFYLAHPYCFPAGTSVVMADRTRKPIEDVGVGEFVATSDGPFPVTCVFERAYKGPGISLRLRGEYEPLVGTALHEVRVYRREQIHCACKYNRLSVSRAHEKDCRSFREPIGDPDWAQLKSVLPGDYLVLVQPEHGVRAVAPHFAELVGWVGSEGYLGANGLVQFTFSENNEADITAVTECLAANGLHVSVTPRHQYGLTMLSACSKEVHEELSKYVVGVKSEKRMTARVLEWDAASLLRLLGAYIDGDGHVPTSGRNRGQLRIRSSSPLMLRMLSDVIRSLGIPATVQWDHEPGEMLSPTNGKIYSDNGSGVVSVASGWASEVTVHSRKLHAYKPKSDYRHGMVGKTFLVQVTEREDIELNERVFNLEVPGPHNYIASEVLVHNCHHRNKDATRAFGDVELAAWHPKMKRVELVVRLDKDKCDQFGGVGVWDKLKAGEFPDVSMGTKVPYDTCFPAGTLVRTRGGNVPIEAVRVGDEVLTHKGLYRAVTHVMSRNAAVRVCIEASGLPPAEPTENHPLLVVRREQARSCKGTVGGRRVRHTPDATGLCRRCGTRPELDVVWAAAETVRPGDYLAVPRGFVAASAYDASPSSVRARLLGYYLGDGYIIAQKTGKKKDGPSRDMGVGFSVGAHEEAHLAWLLRTLVEAGAANAPCVYDAGCDRRAYIVATYDQELAAWVQQFGGRTSHGKALSDAVFSWTDGAKLALVAGYIETDGSFDEGSGAVRIPSVNRGLLLDVQRLLLSMGITASVCRFAEEGAGGYANSSRMWALNLSAFEAQRFLGRTTKVQKHEVGVASPQSFFYGGYWLTPVKSVEELEGEVEVFNLSVEEDESYVAEGRAVHNCSICLDWDTYRSAQGMYHPDRHASPGQSVLAYHKELLKKNGKGIRGVSITRKDYCVHASKQMNHILPDGRKVCVNNDYPKFFDISFVFIGADKTAKTMMKIAGGGQVYWFLGGAELAEKLGYTQDDDLLLPAFAPQGVAGDKTDSVTDETLKQAFLGKLAKNKDAEIVKDVVPSQFVGKAVPLLTRQEKDLPKSVLDALSASPLEEALSTTAGLGMVLRPREFQRIILIQMGKRPLAEQLESEGKVFPKSDETSDVPMGPECFSQVLARLLLPLMSERSALGPSIEKRILVTAGAPKEKRGGSSSLSNNVLRKMGSAYNGYRAGVMELVAHTQELISSMAMPPSESLHKLAAAPVASVFTPLSAGYLKLAFWDELGIESLATVERGLPSRNTSADRPRSAGGY